MSNSEEPKRGFKGVWIRASLWRRKDLTWFEKCLLCEIDNFDGGCFASNAYLADMMGTTEHTIQNAISKFRKLHLIIDWGFDGRKRQISVADCVSSDPVGPTSNDPLGFTQPEPRGSPSLNPEVHPLYRRDSSREEDVSLEKKRTEKDSRESEEKNPEKRTTKPSTQSESSSPPMASPPSSSFLVIFMAAWNSLPAPYKKIRCMTDDRKKHLMVRHRDEFWRDNWQEALRLLPSLEWTKGKNTRGWIADLEWFLKPATVAKIIEGSYESASVNGNHSKPSYTSTPMNKPPERPEGV